jgi:nucleoid DNA-binding protein
MTAITKAAFVANLAETHNMNRQTAREAVNAVVATLTQTLIDGHDIKLPGLGAFSLKERAGRTGRNPATGESLEIPAKRTVQFKVASDLQRQIHQPE